MPGKLEKFADNRRFPNLLEYGDLKENRLENPKGRWRECFGRNGRLVMELACGKGDFTLGYAEQHPEEMVLGVDIKGARLWDGARRALKRDLVNVLFFRAYIEQLETYVAPGELDEIWITFPDPFPKRRQEKKRLVSPRFLRLYRHLLVPGGEVHLKTDSALLWRYALQTIPAVGGNYCRRVEDLYSDAADDPILTIQTSFERQHLRDGKTIRYLRFRP
ncbi:MAG: tRNA (guanosine(46)-N7)-methyltransferase TrmB [Balneolaceae bacterium]